MENTDCEAQSRRATLRKLFELKEQLEAEARTLATSFDSHLASAYQRSGRKLGELAADFVETCRAIGKCQFMGGESVPCDVYISSSTAEARGFGSVLARFVSQENKACVVAFGSDVYKYIGLAPHDVRISMILGAAGAVVIFTPDYFTQAHCWIELALIAACRHIDGTAPTRRPFFFLPAFKTGCLPSQLDFIKEALPSGELPWGLLQDKYECLTDFADSIVESVARLYSPKTAGVARP